MRSLVQVIKFIFREAKLNDAGLVFDECESIFTSRDSYRGGIHELLTEIERHNGLMVMATNRAYGTYHADTNTHTP